jgi:ribosome-binding factor A
MNSIVRERNNSEIYRAFCSALATKANNPALYGATVLRTELANDGSCCRIFLAVGGDAEEQKKCIDAFNRSGGFFRTEIAKSVDLRRIPKLNFIIDKGQENADRVEELLNAIRKRSQ